MVPACEQRADNAAQIRNGGLLIQPVQKIEPRRNPESRERSLKRGRVRLAHPEDDPHLAKRTSLRSLIQNPPRDFFHFAFQRRRGGTHGPSLTMRSRNALLHESGTNQMQVGFGQRDRNRCGARQRLDQLPLGRRKREESVEDDVRWKTLKILAGDHQPRTPRRISMIRKSALHEFDYRCQIFRQGRRRRFLHQSGDGMVESAISRDRLKARGLQFLERLLDQQVNQRQRRGGGNVRPIVQKMRQRDDAAGTHRLARARASSLRRCSAMVAVGVRRSMLRRW